MFVYKGVDAGDEPQSFASLINATVGEFCRDKMKFLILSVLVCALVAAALASPAKDLKEAKKEAAKKKACMQSCDAVQYSPVCASKQGAAGFKPISFGSSCVMNNYNCEKGENLVKISDGECPGGSTVRLS